MDGVGETGAETLPSLQSSGAGLGGVAYFGENWPKHRLGLGHQQIKGLIWQFSRQSLEPAAQSVSHPRAAQKKKRIPKKETRARRAVSCAPSVVLIVSMPRQKAAVSCG